MFSGPFSNKLTKTFGKKHNFSGAKRPGRNLFWFQSRTPSQHLCHRGGVGPTLLPLSKINAHLKPWTRHLPTENLEVVWVRGCPCRGHHNTQHNTTAPSLRDLGEVPSEFRRGQRRGGPVPWLVHLRSAAQDIEVLADELQDGRPLDLGE